MTTAQALIHGALNEIGVISIEDTLSCGDDSRHLAQLNELLNMLLT